MSKNMEIKDAKSVKRSKRRDQGSSTLAASLPLIGFVIFGIIPLAMAVVIAFSELHSTDLTDMKFVGLENFKTILTNGDGHTYWSYLATVILAVSVPITIGLSLYISNLINKAAIGKNFFRAVFFIPQVCSMVVVSMTFRIMFSADGGVVNEILQTLGFQQKAFLSEGPVSFLVVAIVLSVWGGIGFCIVLLNAAISKVDSSYYEAAKLDGATSFQMFWKITWPAITPTTSYLVTMQTIGALQTMASTYVLTSGTSKPPVWPGTTVYANETVVRHIYNMVFENSYAYGYGLAAAAGWILAIIVLIITQINLKLQERWVNYDF